MKPGATTQIQQSQIVAATRPMGFCWLDFSPGGPEVLAFEGWPLVRLMAAPMAIGPEDRKALLTAGESDGDFAGHLAALDEVVARIAREIMARGGQP
jgi:hypothetical protein